MLCHLTEIQSLISEYECDGFRKVEVKSVGKKFNITFYAWDDTKIILHGVEGVEHES